MNRLAFPTLPIRPFVGVLAASAVLLAGCGTKDDPKPPATTPTSTPPTTDPVKSEKAKAAVFQAGDLPAGWKATADIEDGKPAGLQLEQLWGELTTCLGADTTSKRFAIATSPTYLRGLATQARNTVEYLPEAAAQATAAALSGSRFQQCATDAFSADAKRSAPDGGVPGPVTIKPLDFAPLGKSTLSWRVTFEVALSELKVPITQDLIVVFNGEAMTRSTFLNPGSPFPAELQQTLVEKSVSRT